MADPLLVIDIRRPVSPALVRKALRERRWSRFVAVTPLAAWHLRQEGCPYDSGGLADADFVRREGLATCDRLERVFERAFGAEAEEWFGLLYWFKVITDYALAEETRIARLRGAEAHLLTDLVGPPGSMADHGQNRAALYHGRFTPPTVHRLPASPPPPRWLEALRAVTPERVKRRLLSLLAKSGRDGLVSDLRYDWAPLRLELASRFRLMSPFSLAKEALAGADGAPGSGEDEAFEAAYRAEFLPSFPLALDDVLEVLKPEVARYASLKRALERSLPKSLLRREVRGGLVVSCATAEEYLVFRGLKAAGLPVVSYQHGGFLGRSRLVRYLEVLPCTHHIVYGESDREYYCQFGASQDAVRVAGSPLLDELRPQESRPGSFLYVLYLNPGNVNYVEDETTRPALDAETLMLRHQRVLRLFANRRDVTLTVREHPGQRSWCLYEPLREFIEAQGYRNIRLDESGGAPGAFLAGHDGVILDYASTTLRQVLKTGQRFVCFTGPPAALRPEDRELLGRAAGCADDEDELEALLKAWLDGRPPPVDESARAAFLRRYGTPSGSSAERVRGFLQEVFSSPPASRP